MLRLGTLPTPETYWLLTENEVKAVLPLSARRDASVRSHELGCRSFDDKGTSLRPCKSAKRNVGAGFRRAGDVD